MLCITCYYHLKVTCFFIFLLSVQSVVLHYFFITKITAERQLGIIHMDKGYVVCYSSCRSTTSLLTIKLFIIIQNILFIIIICMFKVQLCLENQQDNDSSYCCHSDQS